MKLKTAAPTRCKHKPIITVDYKDKVGDAKFLTLGRASWNQKGYSAKIWRTVNGHWSRQSEELPLWRLLDLTILLAATIKGKESGLKEFVQNSNDIDAFKSFIRENSEGLKEKLEEIKEILNSND